MTNRTNPSPAPKTPVKSSEAFREMLASARRNAKKAGQASTSGAGPAKPQLNGHQAVDQSLSVEWALQPLSNLIEKAQRTGRLNLASRMMSQLPSEIYSQLIPSHSVFHPSNRLPTLSFKPSKPVDLSISNVDEEEATSGIGVKWYETVDLTYLNASLNDITTLEDEIAGFECLEHCDLHHNQLTTLPSPFGLLINLVHLNLSSNKLTEIPLPILALVNLKELDLSNNSLTKLWEPNWKSCLKKALSTVCRSIITKPVVDSTLLEEDQSFEDTSFSVGRARPRLSEMTTGSSVANEDFSDFFPSSPSKRKTALQKLELEDSSNDYHDLVDGSQKVPFPELQKLWLGSNKFSSRSLFGPDHCTKTVRLPSSLIQLDLSKNPLREPIDVSGTFFNGLDNRLSILNLSGCEFGDNIFNFEKIVSNNESQLSNSSSTSHLFQNLTRLDISNNSIDSLGPLETFFEEHAPHHQLMKYVGLPPRLDKILDQGLVGVKGEKGLEVDVTENFLRSEGRRRRAMISSENVVKSPTVVDPTSIGSIVPAIQSLEISSGHEPVSSSSNAVVPPVVPATIEKTDRTWQMVKAAYSKATQTLMLSNRSLSTYTFTDPPPSDSLLPEDRIRTLDISQNQLISIPLQLLHSESLTTLNLSRNKFTTSYLCSELKMIKLIALETLDLSSNQLSSDIQLYECLNDLTGNKNSLKSLNLSCNGLLNIDGIENVLCGKDEKKGLVRLNLSSNRINNLVPIERLAADIMMSQVDQQVGLKNWNCKEIDLSNNDISKLEPVIGRLPIESLLVSGNLFRVPIRKVYEGADGTQRLLKWLRERDL